MRVGFSTASSPPPKFAPALLHGLLFGMTLTIFAETSRENSRYSEPANRREFEMWTAASHRTRRVLTAVFVARVYPWEKMQMSAKKIITLVATVPVIFISLTAISASILKNNEPAPPTGDDLRSVSKSVGEPEGMTQVVAIPATEAELDPQTIVLGVQVNDRYRAYLTDTLRNDNGLSAMFDEIGGHSIIVSYSELQNQLDVRCWDGHSVQIECPFEVTTWNVWQQAHPETHVCSVPKSSLTSSAT